MTGSYGAHVTATTNGVTAETNIGLTNGRVQTTTALQVEPSGSSLPGQTVIFTATVTPAAGTLEPAGNVEFTDYGTTAAGCAAVAPSGGVATCELTGLTAGRHTSATR